MSTQYAVEFLEIFKSCGVSLGYMGMVGNVPTVSTKNTGLFIVVPDKDHPIKAGNALLNVVKAASLTAKYYSDANSTVPFALFVGPHP